MTRQRRRGSRSRRFAERGVSEHQDLRRLDAMAARPRDEAPLGEAGRPWAGPWAAARHDHDRHDAARPSLPPEASTQGLGADGRGDGVPAAANAVDTLLTSSLLSGPLGPEAGHGLSWPVLALSASGRRLQRASPPPSPIAALDDDPTPHASPDRDRAGLEHAPTDATHGAVTDATHGAVTDATDHDHDRDVLPTHREGGASPHTALRAQPGLEVGQGSREMVSRVSCHHTHRPTSCVHVCADVGLPEVVAAHTQRVLATITAQRSRAAAGLAGGASDAMWHGLLFRGGAGPDPAVAAQDGDPILECDDSTDGDTLSQHSIGSLLSADSVVADLLEVSNMTGTPSPARAWSRRAAPAEPRQPTAPSPPAPADIREAVHRASTPPAPDSSPESASSTASHVWAQRVYARSESSVEPPTATALQALRGHLYRGHPQVIRFV